MARPVAITALAAAMIAIGTVGVIANIQGYLSADPAYPRSVWLVFAGLKGLGLAGGILLLRMRRAGVWLALMSFALGIPAAMLANSAAPAWQWIGAGAVTAIILSGGWLAIRNHWHELGQNGPTLGAK